jgi:hypothetical protein
MTGPRTIRPDEELPDAGGEGALGGLRARWTASGRPARPG